MKRKIIALIIVAFSTSISAQTDSTATNYVDKIASWYNENINYVTITALMTVESSFIPFPSEIVVPPAAAVAARDDANMNVILIVVFATLGALLGALINYVLSLTLGRAIIYKFADSKLGHLLMLNAEKVKRAEDYFNDHGVVSTLIGRLIPVIRQLISIPAGLAKMNILAFSLYTALGALIWNIILATLGWIVGDNIDLITHYSHEIGYALAALVVGALVIYFIRKKRKNAA